MTRLKAKVVHEWEYDADPVSHKTDDLDKMAEVDMKSAENDLGMFLEGCVNDPKVKVKVVKR